MFTWYRVFAGQLASLAWWFGFGFGPRSGREVTNGDGHVQSNLNLVSHTIIARAGQTRATRKRVASVDNARRMGYN